ncbi:Dolichyl pyrophosphate Man9GlcNAc2 alpha-1,3-glucosyltransferase [Armadillidium nasatum]|uniref:Alpha-1,3-glucosyltransferase n=1 Tax=Armadillidium nasatum TaxID=96803 RepID=A0A5N5T2Y0_9CRUS|nr:Dolichyl pyrophosphate Man9GlcNAc2 alpha-1,3-glucosyltransferase [Armadillidium nasatum]
MRDYINVCLFGIFLRWCVSLYPYSGAGKPPMFGDYEAQRHWQEITVNLPLKEWYINSTDNDLEYWGLDYPPLTAYHSLLCGLVARYINPNFTTLHVSRGFESKDHKLFMRYTVLVIDLLIFIPAAFLLFRNNENICKSKSGLFSCFSALMLYPGLFIIDYGHFQYNNASLGLFIIAVGLLYKNLDYASGIFFVLALNYKQMELYHSLPFFAYFLGKFYKENTFFQCLKKLSIMGFVVLFTFLVCWFPFLNNFELIFQIIRRIFPIARGLFEDKVASFWCSLSIIFKLKLMFSNSTMALICLLTTLSLSLPSSVHLFCYPKPNVFKYSLINISFIFFLFSFHVHEKSILLVAIPASLVYCEEPLIVCWFFIISIIKYDNAFIQKFTEKGQENQEFSTPYNHLASYFI